MIKLGDIIEVEVEKLTYGAKGLARFGEEKFVVFIQNAIPKDVLKVEIISLNKKFANAKIIEIIKPSEHRIKPFCPIFNACGSCQLQNCDYDYLLEQKQAILKEIFYQVEEDKILPIVKSPEILEYRHKIQFPARQTKNSKRILMGYFKENSHDLTNIKFCPVQPKIMNEIAEFIRENFKLDCYSEKTNQGLLKNVLTRVSSFDKSILLTLVLNCDKNDFERFENEILKFFSKIITKFPEIKGCFVNFNSKNSNKILGNETLKISGQDFIFEKLGEKTYKIGPVSFFQINPKGAKEIFELVRVNIKENSTILDAYGGVGAIGIYVSEKAKKITLVEENQNAVEMAKDNFELNNISNFEIFEGDAKKHFVDFKKKKQQFDYVILDPPRSGCEKEGLEAILKLTKNVIYVSCNPQTLKRDMEVLKQNGFKLKTLQGVDLFPYTYHIESVAVFEYTKAESN